MKESYAFKDSRSAGLVLGANDRNLGYLELLLGTELFLKGTMVSASDPAVPMAALFTRLEMVAEERGGLSEAEIFMELQALGENRPVPHGPDSLCIAVAGRTVWPKTAAQERYVIALRSSQVVVSSGPAGTGKTFLAVAHALSMVLGGKKNKIVLTRPALESGESLGFLPGDLSQKLDPAVRLCDRFVVAFVNTDEVFAVASSRPGTLTAPYMYGLILTPYVGWSFGTLIGALAGNILPAALVSALGIAIYGMFLAIVIPAAKQSRATLFCVLFAVGLGCMFRYVPVLAQVSEGFVMILCAVVASAVFALLAPVPEGEVTDS